MYHEPDINLFGYEQTGLEMQDDPYDGDAEVEREDEASNNRLIRQKRLASLSAVTAGSFPIEMEEQASEARRAHNTRQRAQDSAPSTTVRSDFTRSKAVTFDLSSIYDTPSKHMPRLEVQSREIDETWFSDDEPLVNIRREDSSGHMFDRHNVFSEIETSTYHPSPLVEDSDFEMQDDDASSDMASEDVDTSTKKRKRSSPPQNTQRKYAKHGKTLSLRPRRKIRRSSETEEQG
ncbi:hypothetical protein K491DRAFT_714326 [Lophiostoma macrostomum CBS 122681]|uniref:Uncharacterized protein n=1 Tax=Lophiostoma macrostomum CBS 122681 TaxID=1314788 RepID=A0A6A6TEG8_9PLEO|nr:hypothetical protein K491DRAFT_714326 [Lophiostoma macrostomum CBS 122681]